MVKSAQLTSFLVRNRMEVITVTVIALVGTVLMVGTHAATSVASINADTGTVTSPAIKVADTTAGDGQSVKFGPGSSDPSGADMPSVSAYPGFTQVLGDEFTGTSLNQTTWNGFYQDINQQFGPFLSSHGSVANGVATMSDYADSAANGAASGTNRAGTGLTTRSSWTSGIALVRARADAGVGVTMCLGLIGANTWPPEIDFYEDGKNTTNIRQLLTASTHYGSSNTTVENTNSSVDATQWHTYGVQWNATTISYMVDGSVWASIPNPSPTGTNGLSQPQQLFMQLETLDWGSNNVPINSSTPADVTMDIDWVSIYSG